MASLNNKDCSNTRAHGLTVKTLAGAALLLTTVAMVGCGKSDQNAGQMPAMPVSVVTLEPATVPISAEAVAQTEGAKEVEIRPRVGGILLKRLYDEGATVKEGQAMFQIDPVPYQIALAQARAQLGQQKAKIEQTEREEKRLQGLLETQSISQREYDNAVSDNSVAKAALAQSEASVREAELNLSYTTVTAPVSGVSGRFQFSEGALVSANNSLLTTIVQVSPIWVRFSFSDNELAQLGGRLTDKNVKQVDLIMPDGSQYKLKGKINFAASQIDPTLGTQQLRATFENPENALLPGQFARIRVTTGQRNDVFVVPQVAVLSAQEGKFVFVANEKNEVAIRPVVTGGWYDNGWIILKGLNAGDKVIVDNIIKLRPGAPVNPHPQGEAPAGPSGPKAESHQRNPSKQV